MTSNAGSDRASLRNVQNRAETLVRTLKEARDYAEALVLRRAILEAHGNIDKAAKILQCSRVTVYSIIDRMGLESEIRDLQAAASEVGLAYRPRDKRRKGATPAIKPKTTRSGKARKTKREA